MAMLITRRLLITIYIVTIFLARFGYCENINNTLYTENEIITLISTEIDNEVVNNGNHNTGLTESIKTYQKVIEKMGYNFEKIIQILILKKSLENTHMNKIQSYVRNYPENALKHKFISNKTIMILELNREVESTISINNEEILKYIEKCQNKHNGYCNAKTLLDVLYEEDVLINIDLSQITGERDKLIYIENYLDEKYNLRKIGQYKWITEPNGKEIDSNRLITNQAQANQFIVNHDQVELSRRLTTLLSENGMIHFR